MFTRAVLTFLTSIFLLLPAAAQDRANTILVLDGSGSMWGQIDGVAKITIAQQVVGELLSTLPGDEALGLTVYGHRRKGDCTDIETLVMPGAGSRAEIGAAVNAIKPKGKTPMTDAVRAAAEALRYGEEKATVILVSDGIETCNPDPCAAARALEEAGVDFTAHVIGFDVKDVEALRQMRCLAEETGGTFLSAANASELAAAMTTVAVAPPPPPPPPPAPDPVEIRFAARDGRNGPTINDDLIWTLHQGDTVLVEGLSAPGFAEALERGEYRVEVLRPIDEATAEEIFGVGEVSKTVLLELPEYRPAATLDAVASAPAGATIQVRWTGPNARNDYIASGLPGEVGDISYTYTREGPLLELVLPPTPGVYELRYTLGAGRKVLVTKAITVTPVTASVTPDGPLPAGGSVMVRWEGPDYRNDYVDLVQPGEDSSLTYSYTRDGSPMALRLPAEPGAYELRYVMANKRTELVRVPVTVTAVTATLTPPADLPAGDKVKVGWTGPDNPNDYIAVFPEGSDRYVQYAYTRNGDPAELTLPAEPGSYTLSYVLNQGRTVIASVPITVTAVSATVTPPAALAAGDKVKVAWTGPDNQNDYIAIFPVGSDRYVQYAYTRNGSPADLTLPAEPGDYTIAYVMNQDKTVLASVPVTVTAVSATVTPPAALAAGDRVKVEWTGPDNQNDYIAIFPEGSDRYASYAYTRNGNPAELNLPGEPGAYTLAYVMNQDKTVLASVPVTVTAVSATVTPPAELLAGGQAKVDWTGPDNQNDYIGIFPAGAERYAAYAYTRNGSPATINLPAEPGAYEIRYVLNAGDRALVSVPVTVMAVTASVKPPKTLVAGSTVPVAWTGPDNNRDYIAIYPKGAERYASYVNTRHGTPAKLVLPATPGEYEVAYVLAQGPTVLIRQPVTIVAATATVSVTGPLRTGTTVAVDWKGPDNPRDFIGVVPRDGSRNLGYIHTSRGQPALLKLPDVPGEYDIVYVLNVERTVIARIPVTIE